MVLEMILNYWLSWLWYWKMPVVRNPWIKHFFMRMPYNTLQVSRNFPKSHNHRIPKEDSNYVPLLSSNALTLWSLISRAQLLLKKERHRGRQRLRNSTPGGGGGNSEDEKSADYNVFQFKAYYCRGSRAESGSTIYTWSAAFYCVRSLLV